MGVLGLLAAAGATALATGLGALPVIALGDRVARWRPGLLGFTCGVMAAAAVVGLLLPALRAGGAAAVALGGATGVAFFWLVAARLPGRRGALGSAPRRRALLVGVVLFAHSLPEGFAVGTAWASEVAGLPLFIVLVIALQNIPEGTSVALPMAEAGASGSAQFWGAVATSAPQPVGALVAYALVELVTGLLPASFGFAAGAMLALVAGELAPDALRLGSRAAAGGGAVAGAALTTALGLLTGV